MVEVYVRRGNRLFSKKSVEQYPMTQARISFEELENLSSLQCGFEDEIGDVELSARLAVKIQRPDKLSDWYSDWHYERNWKSWRHTRYHRIHSA